MLERTTKIDIEPNFNNIDLQMAEVIADNQMGYYGWGSKLSEQSELL